MKKTSENKEPITETIDIWVLESGFHCWLFEGNPNSTIKNGFPNYHLSSSLLDFVDQKHGNLVFGHTKYELNETGAQKVWNSYFKKKTQKVYPKKISIRLVSE